MVVNFTMVKKDPLLAHQVAVVQELAIFYDRVFVITGIYDGEKISDKISVKCTNWEQGAHFRNIWKLYTTFFLLLPKSFGATYFFHMADLQAACLSPILRLLRIKNFLWYAHKHYSKYLWWSNFWLTGIITSTSGSCPITSTKVFPIGQGIDVDMFRTHAGTKLASGIHIGRLDQSKNYETIIDAFISISNNCQNMNLVLYGEPSRSESIGYVDFLKRKYSYEISSGLLEFAGSIDKSHVPSVLNESDFFIHAYQGSLDKSLIEATLSAIPVITLNQEYISEFGRWSKFPKALTLENEFTALTELTLEERKKELGKRLNWAIANHSFTRWVLKLIEILNTQAKSGRLRHNS